MAADEKKDYATHIWRGVGVVLFAAMIGVSTWVKPLDLWLYGIPAFLIGMNPAKLFGGGGSGK